MAKRRAKEQDCPICNRDRCTAHLLACFDIDPYEGELGIGLVGGKLYDVDEIDELLTKVTGAWVEAVRGAEGDEPIVPDWISKHRPLFEFDNSIGSEVDVIDVVNEEEDDDAIQTVRDESDWARYAKVLIEALTSKSVVETEYEIDRPLASTRYTN
jgi:hypothetical protein